MGNRKRKNAAKKQPEDESAGVSNNNASTPNVVESFRPQRDTPSENEPEEERTIDSRLQQAHKLPASAYTHLEDQNTIADLTAVSSTHIENETDDDSVHGSDIMKYSHLARTSVKKRREYRKWRKFKKYIYNKDTDAYCNRSIASWCAVCNYYIWIVLFFLGIFMIFLLAFEWRDTRYNHPPIMKINLMDYPNPALSLMPRANESEMIIWYKDNKMADNYVADVTRFLEQQELLCNQSKLLKHPCHFEVKNFGPCSEHPYGYDTNQPCVFLKLNNLLTWLPTAYHKDHDFRGEISKKLAKQIEREAPRHCIYVDCKGSTHHDKTHIGKIRYFPEQAFDNKYFPATLETKTNPVIAIKLDEVHDGYLLNLQCTLLAANIKNRRNSVIKFVVYIMG